MDSKTIIHNALLECARDYNPKDLTAWYEKKATLQIAEDIANNLHAKNIRLVEIFTLHDDIPDPLLVTPTKEVKDHAS